MEPIKCVAVGDRWVLFIFIRTYCEETILHY